MAADRRWRLPGTVRVRTMNRMLGRLQRAHQRQRRFVADASHELRSPVASIRQHAEVALAHPASTTTGELAADGLRRVLRNLGDNAARHAGGRIRFALAELVAAHGGTVGVAGGPSAAPGWRSASRVTPGRR